MKERKVTIRDIAAEAGVHYTTVSRALAGHPKLPTSTIERIRKIADKLGYVPDPMLSALTAYRTRQGPRSYQGNLAWVTNGHTADELEAHEIFNLYHDGAKKRAAELGYALEKFWLRAEDMTPKRAGNILAARNIRGLLICPQPKTGERIDLDWSLFSAVTFGYTLGWPSLHTVASHAFRALVITVDSVRALGYERIGFALPKDRDARTFHLWSGAFLACQQHWPKKIRVPLYCPKDFEEKGFIRWVERYKPEVVISSYNELIDVLEKHGYSIPKDIGFASPSLVTHKRKVSGIDESSHKMGEAAVDILVGMLHRNDRGIPAVPQYLLIEGAWKAGTTLKKRI
ncbi:LacI family DNA-binding transcriptional regulator [Cerasicoccus frondis]|uniref:LacI family DNA-binding transcriptional regulator n=1 Tax=Cerasicoccus frondis TaxID=490090 RepID=UPI0028524BE3|nr:LacI family DNA-binding transcriptional regulator [Cerasicoccus frondis]